MRLPVRLCGMSFGAQQYMTQVVQSSHIVLKAEAQEDVYDNDAGAVGTGPETVVDNEVVDFQEKSSEAEVCHR